MSNKNTKSEDFYLRFEEQLLESQDWPGMYMYKFIVKDGSNEIDQLKKILKAEEKEIESLEDKIIGKIVVENGELYIYNSYGITNCLIIQMENKRKMSAKELINGLKFEENSHVY